MTSLRARDNGKLSPESALRAAIAQWREILGVGAVLDDDESLATAALGCETWTRRAAAIVAPKDTRQVAAVVRSAAAFGIPLYPISGGKNWGYGSMGPSCDSAVIVDLREMNRILEVHPKLAYAIVEPGVTQQDLYEHIRREGLALQFDVTASTPEASIIGNLVERGYGYTPLSDHFLHASDFEVVLADGTIVQTGMSRFSCARAAHLYKWGLGPSLDGIFTQSSFGIVTRATISLAPIPPKSGAFIVRLDSAQKAGTAIEKLRDLKLAGVVRGCPHILNEIRSLSLIQRRPVGSPAALSSADIATLCSSAGISRWSCVGGIWGSSRQVELSLEEIREAFRTIADVTYLPGREAAGNAVDPRAETMRSLINGVPTSRALEGMYWRKQSQGNESNDPLRDRCGTLWISPLVPMLSDDVEFIIAAVEEISRSHGFEPNLAFALVNDRACIATIAIVFDLENESECNSARKCFDALLGCCAANGYYPYRFGSNTSDPAAKSIFGVSPTFDDLCTKMKNCLDPEHILAPGRYGIV